VALKKMLPARARVRRDRRKVEVPADDVVPGDLVLLEAGDRVPADGRLIAAFSLAIDESALTGESQPVDKRPLHCLRLTFPWANDSTWLTRIRW